MSLSFAKILPATIHLLHTRKSYLILEAFGGELFLLIPRDFVCLFVLFLHFYSFHFELVYFITTSKF